MVSKERIWWNLLLYNTSTDKTFQNVKIRMLLLKDIWLQITVWKYKGSNNKKWTKLPTSENKTMFQQTADFDVWEYDYGTLNREERIQIQQSFKESVSNPPVEITAIPRSKRRNSVPKYPKDAAEKQRLFPAYGFYVVYDGSSALSGSDKDTFEKYTVRNHLVKLPYLDPMNLEGTVWRDLSGDEEYQEN